VYDVGDATCGCVACTAAGFHENSGVAGLLQGQRHKAVATSDVVQYAFGRVQPKKFDNAGVPVKEPVALILDLAAAIITVVWI
jgi:hypothetical protein